MKYLAKLAVPVALASVAVPVFMYAQTSIGVEMVNEPAPANSNPAGDSCYIPVFHTNFAFPEEGGVVIRIGDDLYFVPDYMPNCATAASAGTIVKTASQARVADNPRPANPIVNFLVGDPCLVPIYHTNFALNGGKIIRIDNELWYVKSYLPECASI